MAAVGGAEDGVDLLAIGRASGLELANEITQRSFVGDGVDDILDRAFGMFERCFGHLEEEVIFAGDALDVGDQLTLRAPSVGVAERVESSASERLHGARHSGRLYRQGRQSV